MKKFYILVFAFCAFTYLSNAQIIVDDFESYALGPLLPTAHWSNWSQDPSAGNSAENIEVSNTVANSGTQSGFIGNTGAQDALLLLGNLSSGLYTLSFNMFIPSGSEGYFNIQGTIPGGPLVGVFNSGDIYFNQNNGNPGMGVDLASTNTFSFPHDTWFPVNIDFDLDSTVSTYQMTINGNLVDVTPSPFQTDNILGAIDLFSASGFHQAHYDDFLFDFTLSVDEFARDSFSIYPNPVKNILNVRSNSKVDSVSIFNILGELVLDANPEMVSPSLDMSNLPSGIYLVKVAIGDASKTIKIVK